MLNQIILQQNEVVIRYLVNVTIFLVIFLSGKNVIGFYTKRKELDENKGEEFNVFYPWLIINIIFEMFYLYNLLNYLFYQVLRNLIYISICTYLSMKAYKMKLISALFFAFIIQAIVFVLYDILFRLLFDNFQLGTIILYTVFQLVFFVPCFMLAFFYMSLDDRSQLLNKRYFYIICSVSSVFGTITANFITTPQKHLTLLDVQNTFPDYINPLIITILVALILKFVLFRTISYEKIQELTELEKGKILLQIDDLKVYYPFFGGFLKRQIGTVKAVDGVSINVKTGETLGLVGESGCGKSTLAKSVLGLLDIYDGEILFKNFSINNNYNNYLRQKIQIVFQDPDSSLNPRMKVVDIISEPLKNIFGLNEPTEIRRRVLRLLEEVSLKREHLDRFPHEFSGGQKQRIVIARALACNPELIILDEPTSALDVSVQAQILNLLKNLQETYGYGFLFITHNLSVVNHIADQVAVMYLGRIVELGTKKQVFASPTHPYTKALLNSRIKIDPGNQDIKYVIEGEVPSPINPPFGCHFNPRCSSDTRTKECEFENPHKIEVEEGHYIWCVNE